MPKESEFWQVDVRRLRAFGEIDRLEDALKKGTSDCVYGLRCKGVVGFGWVELKRLTYWPRSVIRLPKFTIDQVNFLERWGRAGVGAWLLTQVNTEYFLFHWNNVRDVQSGLRRNEFVARASVHGHDKFPAGRILRCLTNT